MTPALDPVVDAVTPVLDPVVDAVTPALDPVVDAVTPALGPVVDPVTPVLDPVTPVLDPFVDALTPPAPPVTEDSAPVATTQPSEATGGADNAGAAPSNSGATTTTSTAPTAPVAPRAPAGLNVPATPAPTPAAPLLDTARPVVQLDTSLSRARELDGGTGAVPWSPASTDAGFWRSLSQALGEPARVEAGSDAAPVAPPAELPAIPSTPSGGGGAFTPPGGTPPPALYGLLLAFSALALLRFGRLQLRPAQWRCAAFVALLERPG